MGLKTVSGCWDTRGRIRCKASRHLLPYITPADQVQAGDTVVARAAGTDGSDQQFTVAAVETRPDGRFTWLTPVAGSVRSITAGFTPDSSEEQVAREASRQAAQTGELPGA